MRPIRLVCKPQKIDISIPMGAGPAYPTGGFGGWTTVSLQDEIEGTDWEGQSPLTEDVPLLLNGLEDRKPVTKEWQTVKSLGRPGRGRPKPPPFQVYGAIDAPQGKYWVLPANGIEVLNPSEEFLKREPDGALYRVEFVLHLMEYLPPEEIEARRRRRGVGKKPGDAIVVGGTYTVHGDGPFTLLGIAALLYGDYNRWEELAEKNGLHSPFERLRPGKRLRL